MNFIKSVLNGVDLKNWIENVCYVFKVASTLTFVAGAGGTLMRRIGGPWKRPPALCRAS